MRVVKKAVAVVALLILTAGCENMTPRQQRTLSGGAIGAGGGALLGAISGGSPAVGAAVGGAAGALGGYITGGGRDRDYRR